MKCKVALLSFRSKCYYSRTCSFPLPFLPTSDRPTRSRKVGTEGGFWFEFGRDHPFQKNGSVREWGAGRVRLHKNEPRKLGTKYCGEEKDPCSHSLRVKMIPASMNLSCASMPFFWPRRRMGPLRRICVPCARPCGGSPHALGMAARFSHSS